MSAVGYSADSNFVFRFVNHAVLGLKPEIQEHEKNIIEKAGDAGLYVLENLPQLSWRVAKSMATNPKVITVAATSLALLADSYLFYPDETQYYVTATLALIPLIEIPFWAVKFGVWSGTVETITSYGTRAFGRFSNKELMNGFYGVQAAEQEQDAAAPRRGRRGAPNVD